MCCVHSLIYVYNSVVVCQWFWRLGSRDQSRLSWTVEAPAPLKEFCFGIPPELQKMDAVFERPSDGRIFIFSGKYKTVFVFFSIVDFNSHLSVYASILALSVR